MGFLRFLRGHREEHAEQQETMTEVNMRLRHVEAALRARGGNGHAA